MNETKHTPTPWQTTNGTDVRGKNETFVASCRSIFPGTDAANARHIIACVNAHDALREAAAGYLRLLERDRAAGLKKNRYLFDADIAAVRELLGIAEAPKS